MGRDDAIPSDLDGTVRAHAFVVVGDGGGIRERDVDSDGGEHCGEHVVTHIDAFAMMRDVLGEHAYVRGERAQTHRPTTRVGRCTCRCRPPCGRRVRRAAPWPSRRLRWRSCTRACGSRCRARRRAGRTIGTSARGHPPCCRGAWASLWVRSRPRPASTTTRPRSTSPPLPSPSPPPPPFLPPPPRL